MRLFLTRHGETEENINGIMQGHLPGKLSAKGLEQAKKLAQRLKDEKFDVIYSSDLGRTKDTAKEVLKFHKNTPVHYMEEYRERYLGKYQGLPKERLGWESEHKDIESLENMRKRAKSVLDKIYKEHFGQTVLLVGHGGINSTLLSIITGEDSQVIKRDKKPKNTSIYIIDFDENAQGKIILENCTEHLI